MALPLGIRCPAGASRRPQPTSARGLLQHPRSPSVLGRGAAVYGRAREVAALGAWTLAVFLILALASFPDRNWVGPVGEACAQGLASLVGIVGWALPLELVLLGIPVIRGKESAATPGRVAGDLLITVVAAALVQVGWPGRAAFGGMAAGGLVGELFGELGRSLFSTAGSFLVGFACLGLILIGRAAFSFIALARLVARVVTGFAAWVTGATRALRQAWAEAKALERARHGVNAAALEPRIVTSAGDEAIVAALPTSTPTTWRSWTRSPSPRPSPRSRGGEGRRRKTTPPWRQRRATSRRRPS